MNAREALQTVQQQSQGKMKFPSLKSPLSKSSHRLPYTAENLDEIFRLDYLYPPGTNQFRNLDLPDSVLLLLFQYSGMPSIPLF